MRLDVNTQFFVSTKFILFIERTASLLELVFDIILNYIIN
jgi:hypothetical protein